MAEMKFNIIVDECNLGGDMRKCIYKSVINKEGAEVRIMLINTVVNLLASDGENYIVEVNGKVKLATTRDVSGLPAFKELIMPYAFLGKVEDLEQLKVYWQSFSLKHNLVLLENYQGNYHDELTDFWCLYNNVQFTTRSAGFPDELMGGESLTLPYNENRILHFIVGRNWYYIKNTECQDDFSLMVWPESKEIIPLDTLLLEWGKLYKNTLLLYLLLGWFVSCMYMEEVLACRGSRKFPLFALSGMTQSGKTSLIAALMRFWGMNARPSDYTQVTAFAELKQLNAAHGFPIWRDEYRNTGTAMFKESLLRSLYDRSSVYKGTASQELKMYKTEGTLLLSGEGVAIDPAIRRRFVYFEMQDRFKLGAEEWQMAEQWTKEKASLLFYHAIENGFNEKAFQEIMALPSYKGANDSNEEKVCIASLAAVYGLEFGRRIYEMAASFWEREVMNFEDIDRNRCNLADNLFGFLNSYFINTGMFTSREAFGTTYVPGVLNYFAYRDRQLFIRHTPLVAFDFMKGFGSKTTLDEGAVRSALRFVLNGEEKIAKVNGVVSRVIVVPDSQLGKDTPLSEIALNVRRISEKIGRSGRSLRTEMEAAGDEDLDYEEHQESLEAQLAEGGRPEISGPMPF